MVKFVSIGKQPCRFGTSVFDTLRQGATKTLYSGNQHCDRQLVNISKVSLSTNDGNDNDDKWLELGLHHGSSEQDDNDDGGGIPMGRARRCDALRSTDCPTTLMNKQVSKKRKHVSTAVVGIVVTNDKSHPKVLLTRRPPHMRIFPHAWVLPGGSVDDGESLEQAVVREVQEETGLSCQVMGKDQKPVCIWESVYPTTGADQTPIQAHHVVLYYECRIKEGQEENSLKLQPDEVDCAVWLSRQELQQITDTASWAEDGTQWPGDVAAFGEATDIDNEAPAEKNEQQGGHQRIGLEELRGIYPRGVPDKGVCGLAQGSLFALQEYLRAKSSS